MNKKIIKIFGLIALIAIVAVCVLSPIMSSAKMVEIESGKDIDLIYHSIDGRRSEDIWKHEGSLTTSKDTKYILKSNGWAQWFSADHMAFGYKKLAFNYSEKAKITCETTMTSFDGLASNAGAGLMIRSGLNPDAACIMLHFRPEQVMVTYRSKDGNESSQGKTLTANTSTMYPASFKMELIKGQNKVKCYYKVGKAKEYAEYATVPFFYGNEIYVGISAYSNDGKYMSTAKFTSFSYLVEAPEGYTVINPDDDEGTSSEPEEEEKIELPEDLPVQENVLLRETFTDGELNNNNGEKQNDITNPIWSGTLDVAQIEMDEEQTNRWMYEYMKGESHYLAGDRNWTDYKAKYELEFTKEYSEGETNEFYAFVRATDMDIYGYEYYYIRFKKAKPTSLDLVLEFGHSPANNLLQVDNTYAIALDSKELGKTLEDFVGKHILEVEAFDNNIKVFLDGEMMFDYTDESEYIKANGCIGFGSNGAAVKVDNILVTDMPDLLGGDYDNRICGRWNDEEPAYLDRFKQENAIY
ncbi:MAG: hypothetical protein IJP22_02080 [Clostridia bacterium]|nr:hypothetical protein [Clostridia bacterium]